MGQNYNICTFFFKYRTKTEDNASTYFILLQDKQKTKLANIYSSVEPRALHCRILAILPPMSLKNAPSVILRVHLENLLIFSLFTIISIFSVT